MKKSLKYILGCILTLFVTVGISINTYADACGCADDITDEEILRKNRAAQEKVWSMINEYADPDMFLCDPWLDYGPGIYFYEPLTDEQLSILKKEAEKTTEDCSTQYEKIEAIFNYVHNRIEYTVPQYPNPYYVWYNKEGACGNYATLTRTMLISIGIPCMYLTGDNHAYNAAYDSQQDRWIFIDTTNDFIDVNMQYRSMKPMWFVFGVEGLCIDGIYYSLDTGVEDGKAWYDMDWELYTTGVKDKNAKSYKIRNEISDISVSKIGGVTFSECKNVSSITIPNGVKSIGNSAFYDCSSLKEVKIPDTVEILEDSVFSGTGIETMDLSDTNISIMGYSIFDGCELLRSVILPDVLKTIENGCFESCPNLKEVDFSNTKITRIGRQFFGTDNIEKVEFPDTLTSIEDSLFWGGGNALKSIDLSKTKVTTIGRDAFSGCGIKTIKLPVTLESIDERAFYSCTNLKQIDFSKTRLKTIGERAFEDCTSLTSIKFPATLTTLGEGMCWCCEKLKEINLQNTKIIEIPDYAFSHCENATIIRLPDGLKSIGKCSFSGGDGKYIDTLVCSRFLEDELNDMGYVMEGKSPWYPSFYRRNVYATRAIYTVKYNPNGGKLIGSKKVYTGKGIPLKTIASASRNGYVFKGWYTAKKGGRKIKIGSKVSKSSTLYAQWIKKPSKVKGLKKVAVSSKRIKISWKKVSDVKGYDIYRKDKKSGSYKKIASTTKAYYTDKKLKKVKGFYYMVRAYKKVGKVKVVGEKKEIYVSIKK